MGKPAGDAYGPVIPGPETKNPKTSLNTVLTYVKYSSEAKTKLKLTKLETGTKSNSSIAASVVLVIFPDPTAVAAKLATLKRSAFEIPLTFICPAEVALAGPTNSVVAPEDITTPLANPIFEVPPNEPICCVVPVYVTLDTAIPGPTRLFTY